MQGPSAVFMKRFANKPNLLAAIERCKKEFEVYSYLSDRVPTKISDGAWAKLIETRGVEDRVSVWDYVALTERREENDKKKQNKAKEKITEYYKSQQESYKQGGMGYGPGMYRFFLDPFVQLKKEVEQTYDVQQYFAQTLPEQPTLAFDFQHLATESPICNARLAVNMRSVLSDCRSMLHPFPTCMINCDMEERRVINFFRSAGTLNREPQRMEENFLPSVYKGNPFLDKTANRDKEIVYISRYAKDSLDGPLKNDVYILPVTFDRKRESLAGARSGGFRLMSIPFKKYVDWKSGPMFLPLTGILHALRIVSQTGGDWHRALHAVVPKRRLVAAEENRAANSVHREIDKFRKEEKQQVVQAILDTMGEFNCTRV